MTTPRPGTARGVAAVWLAALAAAPSGGLFAGQEETPRRTGREETVTVRLVTMDLVVLDAQDRPIPGLRAEDFTLWVDSRKVPIDTVDESCAEDLSAPAAPRRLLFAFDYLHLPSIQTDAGGVMNAHTKALQDLARTLKALPPGNDEFLIAVLDGGLRIEQPFTADREQTIATLARMEKDVTLYGGHFTHVTEKPLFTGLEALVDIADSVAGSKALVLFTGGAGPGTEYQRDLRALAAHASLARVAFYPVDCAGLTIASKRIPFR